MMNNIANTLASRLANRLANALGLVATLMIISGCATQMMVNPDPKYAPIDLHDVAYKPESNGSIFQAGRSVRLFEDTKAFRVGDVLSITLSESTNASKSAATNTAKDDAVDMNASILLGVTPTLNNNPVLTNNLASKRKFAGTGDSAQSNSLSGEIAVTVVDILPNGTLDVRGEKIIGLNQGAEFIRLSGLVRPQDVSANNIVLSRKLANARIYYGGGGVIAESNTKGWLSRFFDSPFFPF